MFETTTQSSNNNCLKPSTSMALPIISWWMWYIAIHSPASPASCLWSVASYDSAGCWRIRCPREMTSAGHRIYIYIYALFDILCLSWENSLIMFDIIRVHDILHSCCHANSRWLEAKPHAHPLCFASCVVLRNIFFLWCLLTRNGGFLK